MDVNENLNANDSTSIAGDFSTTSPYYDLMDESLVLYPIPTAVSSGGIKIWYEKMPTALSGANDTPSFSAAFHKGLAYGASKDYFEKNLEVPGNDAKLNSATNNLETYIARVKTFYQKRHQDRKYPIAVGYVEYDYGLD